jgi:hypothetical protein
MIASDEKLFGQKLRKSDPSAISFLAKDGAQVLEGHRIPGVGGQGQAMAHSLAREKSPALW